MIFKYTKSTYLLWFFCISVQLVSCAQQSNTTSTKEKHKSNSIVCGADNTEAYLSYLGGKKIAIVANQTSVVNSENAPAKHLVDFLVAQPTVSVQKVFAPEHGFRGKADAGETVKDGIDTKTGLPIISLYGKNKKPYPSQLKGLDLVVFDIQDVGARFYTYISTLHYVMEACAEANIPLLLLDRPNPNAHYIDGPVLEKSCKSFVGMHPVPTVYGMTIGEYGRMINGEHWLAKGVRCELKVIKLKNYTHSTPYILPIKPSPNLPNATAINLYPSLCFFEGTPKVSVGRGTSQQFQVVGTPDYRVPAASFSFVPRPNEGAKYPKNQGKKCIGFDLSTHNRLNSIELKWLITFYKAHQKNREKVAFFNAFFKKLAGTPLLQKQLEQGLTEAAIKKSWQPGLNNFKKTRKKYLLYP